jgi:hypothetical protein
MAVVSNYLLDDNGEIFIIKAKGAGVKAKKRTSELEEG